MSFHKNGIFYEKALIIVNIKIGNFKMKLLNTSCLLINFHIHPKVFRKSE